MTMSSCLYYFLLTLIDKVPILQYLYITVAPYISIWLFFIPSQSYPSSMHLFYMSSFNYFLTLLLHECLSGFLILSYNVTFNLLIIFTRTLPLSFPLRVSSGYVSLPSSLSLYQFCDNNILCFWPLPIWFLHHSRPISHYLFVPISL